MKRLKNLDVLEVSAVKAAANRKKFHVIKNAQGSSSMAHPTAGSDALAEKLMAAFASIPKEKIERCALIAKTAKARVRKAADGDVDAAADAGDDLGLSQDAQDAIRSAFRIIAPYAEELTPEVMGEFQDALGIEADDAADDAADDQAMDEAVDAVGDEPLAKADDGADDDADKAGKADDGADAKDEGDKPVTKGDDLTLGAQPDRPAPDAPMAKADSMPDFADADEADTAAAMEAARKAFAAAMMARGKKETAAKADADVCADDDDKAKMGKSDDEAKDDDDKKGAPPWAKKTVEKSATSMLSALPEAQREAVEMVFKAHNERMAEMEAQHKELVTKSAALQTELKRKEFVAKAASEYGALGRPEDVGEGMLRLYQRDPEGLAQWETIMKAANAQAQAGGADGLFAELGTAMGTGGQGSALAKIQAHVDSVVQKSGTPKSREQLEAEFYETPAGKALYAQSRREHFNLRSI